MTTLGGGRGDVLSAELAAADDEQAQALLRRATGFRRGTERRGRR